MITRRGFGAKVGLGAAAVRMLPEMAYAQRAAISLSGLPKDMVWLNANENPAGPPSESIEAMRDALPTAGRYHYQEFSAFYQALATSEELRPEQIIVGAGSSEVLHMAVEAFTSDSRPLITVRPTYEGPVELARALGRKVIQTSLRPDFTPDVKQLAEAADREHGGLIYLCNPNNPTSTITAKTDLAWLVRNLPTNTLLLIDEAYIHFGETPQLESALTYVREGRDVVVTRTFSKIYGMAGLRAGFGCARPDLIDQLGRFRNNVVSIVTARGIIAARPNSREILAGRRGTLARTRRELCVWLDERKVTYIQPHANFVMIDVGRDAREFTSTMPRMGVAPGRPFPPLDRFLRVTIGTDADMARFREVFWKVYRA